MDLDRKTCIFFGIPKTGDPRQLLGIPSNRSDQNAVKSALRRRLAQLHVHPNGMSKEAEEIKLHIIQLANELEMSPEIVQQPTQDQELTPLDKAIIAVLVSEGGWNKRSRSRLVSIAATYGITVGGLMRILEAFAEAARTGSGPLSIQQRKTHTLTRQWTALPKKQSRLSSIDTFVSDTAKRLTPELQDPSPVMTVKLAALFALLTVMAFVLSLNILFSEESTNESPITIPQKQSLVSNEIVEKDLLLLETYPTFSVGAIEKDILNYSDRVLEQVSILQGLKEEIVFTSSAGTTLPNSAVQVWKEAVDVVSIGWIFVDQSTLLAVDELLVSILSISEYNPRLNQTLLQSFKIEPLGTADSKQLLKAVWKIGVLASLRCEYKLSAVTKEIASEMQFSGIVSCDTAESRYLALRAYSEILLERIEFAPSAFEFWETWFLVSTRLFDLTNDSRPFEHLYQEIVHSDIDLLRESKTRKVLGRLIANSTWASSDNAKQLLCEMLQLSDISNAAVAVVTNLYLLSDTNTWYPIEYVTSLESTTEERVDLANLLQQNWPVNETSRTEEWSLQLPVGFSSDLHANWVELLTSTSMMPNSSIEKLAMLRLLNESAVSVWKGRSDLAEDTLEEIERFDLETESFFYTPKELPEGTLERAYLNARNDPFNQIGAIETLYNSNETDLSKADADLLASIALHHKRYELRNEATKAILELYPNGKNVAVSLVNNFSKATDQTQISSLVANLTTVLLPDKSSLHWWMEARRALVQHAQTAGLESAWELDEVSNVIANSLRSEFLLLNPDVLQLVDETTALEAIVQLNNSWQQNLPDTFLPQTQLRYSATGILQQYLLQQLRYYEYVSAEEKRWRSISGNEYAVGNLLQELSSKDSITEQLIFTETAISNRWLVMLQDVASEVKRREQQK